MEQKMSKKIKKTATSMTLSDDIVEALNRKIEKERRPSITNAAEAALADSLIKDGYLKESISA
jgi:predicted transcriptional regulator